MRPALGAGFAIPTFDRSGMEWIVRGNITIFPILSAAPELGFGHWNLQTAGSEFLSPNESNRQFWTHHQTLKTQYLVLNLRGYPLTRFSSRLSPYLLLGAGLERFTYNDQYIFWGTYNDQFEWNKKALNSEKGLLPLFNGGIGLDMPLDKVWALTYEYRWTILYGTLGQEFYVKENGFEHSGTIGKREYKNILVQYPITLTVEVRPW